MTETEIKAKTMAPPKCNACKNSVRYEDDIRCSVCRLVYHKACVQTTHDTDTATAWTCDMCRGRNVAAPFVGVAGSNRSSADLGDSAGGDFSTNTVQDGKELMNVSHFQAIMLQLSGLTSAVAACNTNIEGISTRLEAQARLLESCENNVERLQEENRCLRERLDALESRGSAPVQSHESFFVELAERRKRENCIIVFGLPESDDDEDNRLAKELIESICPHKVSAIKGCQRIGKTSVKPRLLRLELISDQDALDILRKKSGMPRDRYRNVFIRPDLTKMQREHLAELRSEMDVRRKKGETNLVIKYVRGQPVIATVSKRTREEDLSPDRPKAPKIPKSARGAASNSASQ